MRTMKKNLIFTFAVLMISLTVFSTVPDRKGWWKFDNAGDMLAATIGAPLAITGSQESVAGPESGNLATLIGPGSYLSMTHGISPNGGGTLVNEYTLQLDISIPEGGMYHAVYQTTPASNDDAELFINPDNFIGAWRYGYSTNDIVPGNWYRVVVSVKNGQFFRIYVDGNIWVEGAGQEVDSRDALQSVVVLFGDDDGEDNLIKCAEAGIWDVALTAEEALELGDCYEGIIPTVPTRVGHWSFDNAQDMLAAAIGQPLTLTGTQTSVPGPGEGNLATSIGIGSYLSMTHGIEPNLGGSYVNEFSVQIDFSLPETNIWHAFIQTNVSNSNDADLFTNTSNAIGVGDVGYSENTLTANTWYRMILSVKNGEFFKVYIDGVLWLDGAGQPLDGRYGLDPVLNIFGDDDGDDGQIICSELGIWDVALTADEAATLGGAASSSGINDYSNTNRPVLNPCSPNPCAESTSFTYQLTESSYIQYRITDVNGQEIMKINKGWQTPGTYSEVIHTNELVNGICYIQLIAGKSVATQKMVVVR